MPTAFSFKTGADVVLVNARTCSLLHFVDAQFRTLRIRKSLYYVRLQSVVTVMAG